jgi:hypothetical protein
MAGTVSWFMIFVALRYWDFRGLRLSDAIVPLVMVPVFSFVLWASHRGNVAIPVRTGEVTAVGVLFLLIAILLSVLSVNTSFDGRIFAAVVLAIFAAIFTTAGYATFRRWPSWRRWAGGISLVAITICVIAIPVPFLFFLTISIFGFVLWAMFAEPRSAAGSPGLQQAQGVDAVAIEPSPD